LNVWTEHPVVVTTYIGIALVLFGVFCGHERTRGLVLTSLVCAAFWPVTLVAGVGYGLAKRRGAS
jgi:hypothetical protein